MNNKGFAITGMLYSILIIFMVMITTLLFNLQNRKTILDELKADAINAVESQNNYEYLLNEINTLKAQIGTTDISGNGDGTVTGAISNINNTVYDLNNGLSRKIDNTMLWNGLIEDVDSTYEEHVLQTSDGKNMNHKNANGYYLVTLSSSSSVAEANSMYMVRLTSSNPWISPIKEGQVTRAPRLTIGDDSGDLKVALNGYSDTPMDVAYSVIKIR